MKKQIFDAVQKSIYSIENVTVHGIILFGPATMHQLRKDASTPGFCDRTVFTSMANEHMISLQELEIVTIQPLF